MIPSWVLPLPAHPPTPQPRDLRRALTHLLSQALPVQQKDDRPGASQLGAAVIRAQAILDRGSCLVSCRVLSSTHGLRSCSQYQPIPDVNHDNQNCVQCPLGGATPLPRGAVAG